MLPTYRFELDWIAAFQGDGTLKGLMIWCSYFGAEVFPFLLPLIHFVFSQRAGQRLYLLFSLTASCLHIFKLAFHLPRPFWIDPRIRGLDSAGGFGMPSGHAIEATVVWSFVAKLFGQWWIGLIALVVILLVSVSRVYLGVHFVSDVVGAWCLGAALLCSLASLERKLKPLLGSFGIANQILVCLCVTASLFAIGLALQPAISTVATFPSWKPYAISARKLGGLSGAVGGFFGAGVGVILARRWARFGGKVGLWRRARALAYALAGAWLIRETFRMLPSIQSPYVYMLVALLKGTVSNLWILFLAPWLFLQAGLLRGSAPKSGS